MAGGTRIKEIKSYSEAGLTSQKEYKYTSSMNETASSGILMNWPRYIYYWEFTQQGDFGPEWHKTYIRTSSNIISSSLDSYNVGYKKVFEIESGKGYTEFDFSNYETHPDQIMPDAGNIREYNVNTYANITPVNLYKNFNNLYSIDKSIIRGKLLNKKIYLQSDLVNPIQVTSFDYTDNMEFNPNNQADNNKYVSINHMSGKWVQGYRKYMNSSYIKKKTIRDYLNNNEVKTETEYFYDSVNHLNLNREQITDSDNNILESSYKYAMGNTPIVTANMVGIPLETETKKNGKLISKTETKYENLYPSELFPSSVISYDIQNNSPSTEVTYDMYLYGNLQQYTTKEGVPVTLVWGYNNTKVIAKIEGIDWGHAYSTVMVTATAKSDLDVDAASEQILITALDNIRKNSTFLNTRVTTYTYDPLIGVTSITPPSGIREVYLYDSANRLKEVRQDNAAGKLLKEFKYNYKN